MSPMLAAKVEGELRFPLMASVKIDGVRAIVSGGIVLSRSLKPIPNEHVQDLFGHLEGFDGELVVGDPYGNDVMQRTTSGVMSRDGRPDVTYYAFDYIGFAGIFADKPYVDRLHELKQAFRYRGDMTNVCLVHQSSVLSQAELDKLETKALLDEYEGVMVRDPYAPYKFGRSTFKEHGLIKVKRFVDSDALITGYEEMMHNDNPAETNELGRTQRSTAKAGMRPAGVLGALLGTDVHTGAPVRMGSGFTAKEREKLWAERDSLAGRVAVYKSFQATGVKDAPRFPVFKAFRSRLDL